MERAEGSLTGIDIQQVFKSALKNQYHSALAMLRESIEQCPEELWFSEKHVNACWQIAYHTLFFTHIYLQVNEAAFRPWRQHQGEVQHPDGYAGPADPGSSLPLIPKPYTRAQVLEYWNICDTMVDPCVEKLDLTAPADGFSWKKKIVPTAEFQITNVRHLQHGASLLAARLRSETGTGIEWVGSWNGPTTKGMRNA
jgi:hypothetical protein